MKRKRITLTVNAEPYEALRKLTKQLDFRDNWLSLEIDKLIGGLLAIAEQAKKDAESREYMTETEARSRYEELMRKFIEGE